MPSRGLSRALGDHDRVGHRSVRKSRSEEHTSELQSQSNLVCRLLLEKKKKNSDSHPTSSKPHNYCKAQNCAAQDTNNISLSALRLLSHPVALTLVSVIVQSGRSTCSV